VSLSDSFPCSVIVQQSACGDPACGDRPGVVARPRSGAVPRPAAGMPQARWQALRLTAAVMVAVLFLSALSSQCACACSTLVYRYAMYNWATAPYYVFYFHHGAVAPEDKPVHELIRKLGEAEPPANLVLEVIDGSDPAQLEQYPQIVVDAWHACDEGAGATVSVVFTAWGAHLFSGRLDEQNVRALVDSPARKQIGRLLDQGNAAVMLMLTGPDAKVNARAEKAVQKLVAEAAAGKFDLEMADPYGLPEIEPQNPVQPGDADTPETGSETEAVDEQPAAEPGSSTQAEGYPADAEGAAEDGAQDATEEDDAVGFKLAVLKVARDDKAEQWLVRSLLAVEPDLEEFPEEPMVFGIYGRGRALPPFIGKGINYENLLECVYFLMAPCSCQIKDQNPGMDLLMCWDWEKTADAWMATDEALAADDWQYDYPLPVEQPPGEDEGASLDQSEPNAQPADEPGAVVTDVAGSDEPVVDAGSPETPAAESVESVEDAAEPSESALVASVLEGTEPPAQANAPAPGAEKFSRSGSDSANAHDAHSSVGKAGPDELAAEPKASPAGAQAWGAEQSSLPPCCAATGVDSAPDSAAATPTSRRLVWIVGAVLGGGAFVVFVLGSVVFVVLRAGGSG